MNIINQNTNKRTFSWINPLLKVKSTGKYGKGVYAKENIPQKALLAIFGGHVLTREEEEKTTGDVYDNAIQIGDNFVIGAIKMSEMEDASYFNHSCDPNAGINGQIFLVAMRDIKIDEQITFDYAMVLNKAAKVKEYKIKCLCESKNCRKIITNQDWKKPFLQKKYKGFFSYHLQEKINNLKK
ncbi:MAG: hypothetical protein A2541_01870 [Candidatus Taylorbacteria bacterium RIFOXYD2_FULL_36_9]|uniref:SET domain-containing protein n=1 Tax=Candidatus Taylorbacteria bacterium RIFOXYD2_FULL_36_9 TaxID=1802338 RepID=A0A1G2PG21_9BACT|nr:MAG: hypothetical protein A2541_01870 [Candidatus Taylorbacteria bacterium RIFOXYD2_FULL_36_9]